jgi:hypothetical protein
MPEQLPPFSQPVPPSRVAVVIGWILGILPTPLLFSSAVIKFIQPKFMMDDWLKSGWPQSVAIPLGAIEFTCTLLYLIPQTAMLGAIVLTGYMGGAIAHHVRLGEPFFIQAALPVLLWLGLYLRDPRLRALIPIRRK